MSLSFCLRIPYFTKTAYQSPRSARIRIRFLTTASSATPKRIVFLGTPHVAAAVLKTLHAASTNAHPPFEISAVVTQPPAPQGRKRILTKSPVHTVAEQLGISPILVPARAGEPHFIDRLTQLQPHLCITAAYGNFLPSNFLSLPKHGTLNIHPSLLPKFRGAAPVPRSLEAGVHTTGVTILYTVLKMDAGPIVAKKEKFLLGNEQSPELLSELFQTGTQLLLDALPTVWTGTAQMVPQNHQEATQAPKLSKQEARLSFTENACIVHNKIRAFAGWPGTWADFCIGDGADSEPITLKIAKSIVLRSEGGVCFGIHQMDYDANKRALIVTCGDGSRIGLLQVQPPGKKQMDATGFWNGLRGRALFRKRVPH